MLIFIIDTFSINRTIRGKEYTGVLLPTKASVHVHSDEARIMPRTEDTMEVRIDEDVHTKEQVRALGIGVGDFVTFDPRAIITDNGYIKARYLDDKACVAVLFGVCKYLIDNNIKPKNTTHFFISNYEEIGHGVDATHHYERTHVDSLLNNIRLVIEYVTKG